MSFVGAASVFAKLLATGLPALRAHAYQSSWAAETALYETYATFVTGLVHVLDGTLWLLTKCSLNVPTSPLVIVKSGK